MFALMMRLQALAKNNMQTYPEMKSYHAAALIGKGNKVLAYGVNIPRGYVRGKSCSTVHAEQQAILNFYHNLAVRWTHRGWRIKGERAS